MKNGPWSELWLGWVLRKVHTSSGWKKVLIVVTLISLATALKKARGTTPLCFGVKSFSILFFFSGTIWDVGSCAQQADPLFQNRNHFGGGKNDFTFPRLRDSFCFATAHEPAVLLLREKMSYWRLTKKDNYKLSLRWCLVSPKQHSSPPGARQLTEYPEEEVKEQGWSRQV